jgi:hypothetical protein
MIDPITAPSTVNRFDGLLDGTQATALRFVYHTMTLEPSAGQFEMPSGRMVSDHDPEYLDWFFASAWGTTRKAAAWLGVPEPLFVAACAVVVDSFNPKYVWQTHMLAAATLEQRSELSPEMRASVRAGVVRLFGMTAEEGMHVVARINIRNAVTRARPPVQSDEPHTFVYFLRSGRRMKIGRSDNPKRRVLGIAAQAGTKMTLEAAIPARWEDETAAHAVFAASRRSGEWFTYSPELQALVALAKTDPAEALRVIRLPPPEALAVLANENGSKKAG